MYIYIYIIHIYIYDMTWYDYFHNDPEKNEDPGDHPTDLSCPHPAPWPLLTSRWTFQVDDAREISSFKALQSILLLEINGVHGLISNQVENHGKLWKMPSNLDFASLVAQMPKCRSAPLLRTPCASSLHAVYVCEALTIPTINAADPKDIPFPNQVHSGPHDISQISKQEVGWPVWWFQPIPRVWLWMTIGPSHISFPGMENEDVPLNVFEVTSWSSTAPSEKAPNSTSRTAHPSHSRRSFGPVVAMVRGKLGWSRKSAKVDSNKNQLNSGHP